MGGGSFALALRSLSRLRLVCQQHMSFRVSPCLEASSAKYEVEEVEEATTQALSGSLCFCWCGLRMSAWLLQAKAGFDQAGSVKAG